MSPRRAKLWLANIASPAAGATFDKITACPTALDRALVKLGAVSAHALCLPRRYQDGELA
jgi:hypothetical protein